METFSYCAAYRLQRELHDGEAEGKQESNEELADHKQLL